MNYTNTISGETQSYKQWLEETKSEGYHLMGEVETTPEEYIKECINDGGLVVSFYQD